MDDTYSKFEIAIKKLNLLTKTEKDIFGKIISFYVIRHLEMESTDENKDIWFADLHWEKTALFENPKIKTEHHYYYLYICDVLFGYLAANSFGKNKQEYVYLETLKYARKYNPKEMKKIEKKHIRDEKNKET